MVCKGVIGVKVRVSDRKCTRTGRSSRQALLSGDLKVTACERVIGQDNSVNISCLVASVELTSSVLMILSSLYTMHMSERHEEVACTRGITWRFGPMGVAQQNVSFVSVCINGGRSCILWEYILIHQRACDRGYSECYTHHVYVHARLQQFRNVQTISACNSVAYETIVRSRRSSLRGIPSVVT